MPKVREGYAEKKEARDFRSSQKSMQEQTGA